MIGVMKSVHSSIIDGRSIRLDASEVDISLVFCGSFCFAHITWLYLHAICDMFYSSIRRLAMCNYSRAKNLLIRVINRTLCPALMLWQTE